eukprot:2099499-Pleurochrysis_carterae.AAC.1
MLAWAHAQEHAHTRVCSRDVRATSGFGPSVVIRTREIGSHRLRLVDVATRQVQQVTRAKRQHPARTAYSKSSE